MSDLIDEIEMPLEPKGLPRIAGIESARKGKEAQPAS